MPGRSNFPLSTDGVEVFQHPDSMPITRFQVMGERCSGTNYLHSLMINNTTLQRSEYLGWKHSFASAQFIPRDLLPIVVFRNPNAWIKSMFRKPWHRAEGVRELPFSEWLRKPFTTSIDHDLWNENLLNHYSHWSEIIGAAKVAQRTARIVARNRIGLKINKSPDNVPGFAKGAPHQQDRHPLTGLPFADILALRNAKVESSLSYRNRECSYAFVQYEVIKEAPERFFAQLQQQLGITAKTPLEQTTKWLGEMANPRKVANSETEASADDLAYIRANLSAEQERDLGYEV